MVYLNRIYTKFGDAGQTQLGNGASVSKTSLRVVAMGDVDELNCQLGVVLSHWTASTSTLSRLHSRLSHIQNQLFDLGADLCLPDEHAAEPISKLKILEQDVHQIESWIDDFNESLSPLTSFILPGGSTAAAGLHLARAICRRAERTCWQLHHESPINAQVTIYLNRLSDLLFVAARITNQELNFTDPLWRPGSDRADS